MIRETSFTMALLLAGCTAHDSAPEVSGGGPPADVPAAPAAGPVLARLRTQGEIVTIHGSGDGPRYSVQTADGTLLAADLALGELRTRFEDLYDTVESGLAGAPYLDATGERPKPAAVEAGSF